MACCPQQRFSFANVEQTTLGYSESLRAKFGNTPNVEVFYVVGEAFALAGVDTVINLIGNPLTQIIVYHGGPQIGFIKLS